MEEPPGLTVKEEQNAAARARIQAGLAGQRATDADPDLRRTCLLAPYSTFRGRWDMWLLLTLVYTAIVTPFEIAFLDPAYNVIFGLNRVVDITFITDMAMIFFTPYISASLGIWILSHRDIALNYLTTWFCLDAISVVPFDLIALLENNDNLKIVRIFRLLRLLKLVRIFRASRIIKKWEEQMTVKYGTVALVKFSVGMLVLAHWMSCVLGLIPFIEGTRWQDIVPADVWDSGNLTEIDDVIAADNATGNINWYIAYFEDDLGLTKLQYGIWQVYLAGFYLASMTLTTLGYGDVVAKTDPERGVMLVIMLVGASAYAYAVGSIFGIISSMDNVRNDHKATLDSLNDFMEHQHLNHELRVRVRKLFMFSLQQRRHVRYKELLSFLSPSLRQEASHILYHDFLEKVPFVSRAISPEYEYDDFVAALAERLTLAVYPSWETLLTKGQALDRMFIVERGAIVAHVSPDPNADRPRVPNTNPSLLVRNSVPGFARREITKGNCVGHEMIRPDAVADYYATTVVMSEVHTLLHSDFAEVVDQFPETKAALKKFVLRRNWMRLKVRADEEEDSLDKPVVVRDEQSVEDIVSDLKRMKERLKVLVEAIQEKSKDV